MANLRPPPINELVIETTGLMKKAWIEWVTNVFTGDTGTTFTPLSSGIGGVGTPTLVGAYYRDGQFMDGYIYIQPGGGGNTSSTAGSTYIELPFDVIQDGANFANFGNGAVQAIGGVQASTNRVYPPTWTAVTVPLTITFRVLGK